MRMKRWTYTRERPIYCFLSIALNYFIEIPFMIKEFVFHPKVTGAITKVWDFSIKNACKSIDRNRHTNILEIWWWQGNITSYILEHKSVSSSFQVIEIQESFYKTLKQKFWQQCAIIPWDFLQYDYTNQRFDLVISTVPLSLLDNASQTAMIQKTFDLLYEWGSYIHIQYSHLKAKNIQGIFGNSDYDYCFLDFPFTCSIYAKKQSLSSSF